MTPLLPTKGCNTEQILKVLSLVILVREKIGRLARFGC